LKDEIANQIICATCSKSLRNAIDKIAFKVADFDLLILAYKHAPDYDKRLELLRLIQDNAEDSAVREQAEKCIRYEKDQLSRFVEDEEDCIFEVKIKEKPTDYEESYLAKTYRGALNKVKFFCEEGEFKATENLRFSITKRRVADEKNAKDFSEDWRGSADFKADGILLDVWHNDVQNLCFYLYGFVCGHICMDCEKEPFPHIAPSLPHFLKNEDLVCYDKNGAKEYLVTYGTYGEGKLTDDTDDCAYCIDLDKEIFDCRIKTKEAFYEKLLFGLHTHIEYPRLEVVSVGDLPADKKEAYERLLQLYKLYGSE
jgi:hypothetical protein